MKRQSAEFSSIGQEHCEFPALLIHSKTSQDFSFVFAHRFLICIGEMHKPQIFVSRTWKNKRAEDEGRSFGFIFVILRPYTARQEMMMEKYFFKDIKVDEVHARLIILPSHQMIFYVFHVETAKMSFFWVKSFPIYSELCCFFRSMWVPLTPLSLWWSWNLEELS